MIAWNPNLKLIISDVDETIADLYVAAEPQMISELNRLLESGISIFFVTGQGLKSVRWRIVDKIPQELRRKILIGHCSGAEVWGFEDDGNLNSNPFYSVYNLTEEQKTTWRVLVKQLIEEFELKVFPATPVEAFLKKAGKDPLAVMMEDRGPQITFEVVNGYDLSPDQTKEIKTIVPETHGHYDLRIPLLERAEELFDKENLPISPRLGGVFAIDFAVRDVNKTTAVKHVLNQESILNGLGLKISGLKDPNELEIWGDKFSVIRGGSDRHMSEAVSPEVRSIDFREENPDEFPKGFNIVLWDGEKHLHHGLLEYLVNRV